MLVTNDLRRGGPGIGAVLADSFTVGDRFRDCSVCPEMVVVPLGDFVLGSPPDEIGRTSRESLQRKVSISEEFAMSLYEIKISEWKSCAAASACSLDTPAELEGGAEFGWREWKRTHPVVGVSWEEGKEYTLWLTLKTGFQYRLPTETEWEHAARSGTNTARFWDTLEGTACEYANLEGSSGCADGDGYDDVAPVGSYRSNAFGLYDMIGNAAEWTESCWGKDYDLDPMDSNERAQSADTVGPDGDAVDHTGDCNQKVYRGGAWNSNLDEARSASRAGLGKDIKRDYVGFRVVRVLP